MTDIRVYQSLRSAHLERAHEFTPTRILFRRLYYDFDPALASGLDLVQVRGPLDLVRHLLATDVERLEINEPLARGAVKDMAVAVAAVRVSGLLRRRRTRVVTYALENRTPFSSTEDRSRGGRLRAGVERRLTWYVARNVDRIAFGTGAARDLYEAGWTPLDRAEQILIPALPSPCTCVGPSEPRRGALFLGRLDERKGVLGVLSSWPQVLDRCPHARLMVVGMGPLADQVLDLARGHPSITVELDPPRQRVHRLLRQARVLVLPSQPTPHWREQVGLPIVEGLAHGCTVVTTTETGLAGWLQEHGHHVLDPQGGPQALAQALACALENPIDADDVLAQLPSVDGRKAADTWLFSDRSPSVDQGPPRELPVRPVPRAAPPSRFPAPGPPAAATE